MIYVLYAYILVASIYTFILVNKRLKMYFANANYNPNLLERVLFFSINWLVGVIFFPFVLFLKLKGGLKNGKLHK